MMITVRRRINNIEYRTRKANNKTITRMLLSHICIIIARVERTHA